MSKTLLKLIVIRMLGENFNFFYHVFNTSTEVEFWE